MSGHTPGTWKNDKHSTYVWSEHGNVCACGDPHASGVVGYTPAGIGSQFLKEAVANARLIAAAPDHNAASREIDRLSLVIESAVRNAEPSHHAKVLAALKANRAAIAKAEGTTSNE